MAAGDGLISMKPTSIAHAGTSASINADGGVDFSAVTSLSLNGVFTSDYDNYLVVVRADSDGQNGVRMRLRASGSDNSTASSYVVQRIIATSTTIIASRATNNLCDITTLDVDEGGFTIHYYGPFLTQPTAFRSVTNDGGSSGGVRIIDHGGTHNQSTSYDGFSFFHETGNFTGNIHVFGYEE